MKPRTLEWEWMARLISGSNNPSHKGRIASLPHYCCFSCELLLVSWNQIDRQSALANRLSSKDVCGNHCIPPNTFFWSSAIVNNCSGPWAASNAHLLHNYSIVEIVSVGLNSFPWTRVFTFQFGLPRAPFTARGPEITPFSSVLIVGAVRKY